MATTANPVNRGRLRGRDVRINIASPFSLSELDVLRSFMAIVQMKLSYCNHQGELWMFAIDLDVRMQSNDEASTCSCKAGARLMATDLGWIKTPPGFGFYTQRYSTLVASTHQAGNNM